ncbi:MAG: hypothetical protein ACHP7N_12220 [Caulobacterales bacterium]
MKISNLMACALAGACLVVGGAVADEMGISHDFELPRDVVSAATAFENYMNNAASIGRFSGSSEVAQSVRTGAGYEPAQLEEGMIGYGAIAALQDDRFVYGVDRAAGRGEDRRAFAERLIEDPFEATQIDGAASAARRVEAALASRAAPLMSAAKDVKAAAYSVQHQAWSKVMVDDAQGRLAEIKRLSNVRLDPSESDNQKMMVNVAIADSRMAADDAPAGFSAIEAKALALAAESVLGHAHGEDRARLAPLLTETSSAQCLRMSKLNLYQCMAVAGPEYEDIFCLGQHAMMDTSECVDHAAHAVAPTRVATASSAAARGAYAVPLVAHHSLRIDPN